MNKDTIIEVQKPEIDKTRQVRKGYAIHHLETERTAHEDKSRRLRFRGGDSERFHIFVARSGATDARCQVPARRVTRDRYIVFVDSESLFVVAKKVVCVDAIL